MLNDSLSTLLRELVHGPAPEFSFILNAGDIGLLRSLDASGARFLLRPASKSALPALGAAQRLAGNFDEEATSFADARNATRQKELLSIGFDRDAWGDSH